MPTGPRRLDTTTLSEVIKGRDLELLRRAREYLSIHSTPFVQGLPHVTKNASHFSPLLDLGVEGWRSS
jgi:predicted nucleic acid-binding protein